MAKSYRAVFFPREFLPFEGVGDAAAFAERWRGNRPWVLANMAHAAYHPETVISGLMTRFGAAPPRVFNARGAQAFLAVWPDKAVLAFRGSEPVDGGSDGASGPLGRLEGVLDAIPRVRPAAAAGRLPYAIQFLEPVLRLLLSNDVAADLTFHKVEQSASPRISVHQGFLRELDKLWVDGLVLGELARLPGTLPVWVTGHSLGGAVAALAGTRWVFEEVMTFGEPRVGVGIEASFRARRHTRYVNGDDPVPTLPPSESPFDYQHHGEAVRIGDPDGRADFRYDHAIIYYAANLARP
jgi:Lipase (class 3)